MPPTESGGTGPSLQELEETVLMCSVFPNLPDSTVMPFKGRLSESVSPQSLGTEGANSFGLSHIRRASCLELRNWRQRRCRGLSAETLVRRR